MGSVVWGIISPFLPYIVAGLGLLAAYFGVKHKGKVQAQAEFKHEQDVAVQKVQQDVVVAVGKDQMVDKKVEDKLDEIKQQNQVPVSGDSTKFKF